MAKPELPRYKWVRRQVPGVPLVSAVPGRLSHSYSYSFLGSKESGAYIVLERLTFVSELLPTGESVAHFPTKYAMRNEE